LVFRYHHTQKFYRRGLYGVDLENFEPWLRPEDPAVLQISSVLDTKFYYPEPFVHEDV
jgi:hypothetical protein